MKFDNVQDSFNHYRSMPMSVLETRAREIEAEINANVQADVQALDTELRGIAEAKKDINEARSAKLHTIETMKTEVRSFDSETVSGTQEYRTAFLKHLLGREMSETEQRAFSAGIETRADAFNASTDTLAVLPETLLNEVVAKARAKGGVLAHVRKFNMPTKVAIPVGTPADGAVWHTEGAAIETEKADVTSVSFDGFECCRIISVSNKVRKMSIPAFEAYLVEELTQSVMETINAALINGDGSNKPTGLMTSITQTVSATTEITYDDVIEAVATIKRGYSQGAKFAMNNATLWRTFYGMKDNNERPILIQNVQADGISKILGFEVIVDDHIADNVVLFGNFQYAGVNMPEPIAVEVSTQSGFRNGVIDFRALAIADAKAIVPEAFVKIVVA